MANQQQKGAISEMLAAHYLTAAGFIITDTNIHSRYGEIDIIAYARNYSTWQLIEVKSSAYNNNEVLINLSRNKFIKMYKTFKSIFPDRQGILSIVYVLIVWSSNYKYVINQEHHEIHYEDWH